MENKKVEFALKMNIYTELENQIQNEDCFDISYAVCKFISNCLKEVYDINYYVHSSKINEEFEKELNTFCTFYIETTIKTEDEIINDFLSYIGDNIPKIDNNLIVDETLNIQIQDYFFVEQ